MKPLNSYFFVIYLRVAVYMLRQKTSPLGFSSYWQKDFRRLMRRSYSPVICLFAMVACVIVGILTPLGVDLVVPLGVPVENVTTVATAFMIMATVFFVTFGCFFFMIYAAVRSDNDFPPLLYMYRMYLEYQKDGGDITDVETVTVDDATGSRRVVSAAHIETKHFDCKFSFDVAEMLKTQATNRSVNSGIKFMSLITVTVPATVDEITIEGIRYTRMVKEQFGLNSYVRCGMLPKPEPMSGSNNTLDDWFNPTQESVMISMHQLVSDMITDEAIALSHL